uniref:Uncharacterized protein n=1 Tax=Nelumbo nucifera TaxID=4432 RepID=A0A822XLD6_NELNU|nr:TPA_asm: hypothetical protein HUJ06_022653 [Nelumbo nucifera]
MESETHLLEINLIFSQGLKPPTANLRRMQTYAVAWVNSTIKLHTRVDHFIFRVSSAFLSTIFIEIYVIGYLKDTFIGTVRFLIGNCLSSSVPSFSALQIHRPSSDRFHNVFNIGAMVIKNRTDFMALNGFSAIRCRELMGKNCPRGGGGNHRRQLRTDQFSFVTPERKKTIRVKLSFKKIICHMCISFDETLTDINRKGIINQLSETVRIALVNF